jgi:hypothetical protein
MINTEHILVDTQMGRLKLLIVTADPFMRRSSFGIVACLPQALFQRFPKAACHIERPQVY